MECHRCPNRMKIENGEFAQVAYSETPCAKCELKENSDLTMEYIPDMESGIENPPSFAKASSFAEATADKTAGMEVRMGNIGPQTEEKLLPLSVMNELVVRLMSMPTEIRDVVCWRFTGMSFVDIAAVQGVTMAGAEARLWRALKKWPELRALFATKLARHGRRKPVSGRPKAEGSRRRKQVLRGVEIEKRNG